jgi:23S rRNA (adenine2503-C2)-methyltransferase
MRARQLWNWLYVRGVHDYDAMTNIAKDVRGAGRTIFDCRPQIVAEQISR